MVYITELNKENYEDFTNELSMVVFISSWCSVSNEISPIIDKISEEHTYIKIGKCDTDKNIDKVIELKIRNTPCIFIYKDGEIIDSLTTEITEEAIINLIHKYVIFS